MTTTVTVLGTGIMGAGMARNLVAAGLDVTVWNRSPDRARPLADAGARTATDAAEAVAGADVVVTMLFDADATAQVMEWALPAVDPGAVWVQTGTVGLDGTARLVELAERYGAALYLDEAHATGVLGLRGAGLAADVLGHGGIRMGTLGKALGGYGAYVAGSRALVDLVVTRCAGFIYATAPPPAVFGALEAALDLVPTMDAARARLLRLGDAVRAALAGAGFSYGASSTQIVPVVLGDPLAAQAYLEEAGFRAIPIRPPTVPAGSSRLRLSLRADLAEEEVAGLLDALPGLARFA